MVLYFANYYQVYKKYPQTLLDINIASDYQKIKSIFKIQGKEKDNFDLLRKLTEEGVASAELTYQFTFEKEFSKGDVLSLLFYMGFLTIKGNRLSHLVFGYPNFVIHKLYAEYFIDSLQRMTSLPLDTTPIGEAIITLAETGNPQLIVNEAVKILEGLSNRDAVYFNEVSLKAVFVSLLRLQSFYYVHSEYETGRTYIDVFLEAIKGYEPNFEVAIELKYFKKSETPDLEKEFAIAEIQLKNYLTTEKFITKPKLKSFVIIGVGAVVEWREAEWKET